MSLSEDLTALTPSDPRILTLDIETSPNIVYAWGIWNQNIATSQLIEPSRVLCFAAKWLDRKRVEFYSEQDGRDEMLRAAWSMIDEADVIVGYNHVKFDLPHLHREFLLAGMPPPSPVHNIDLLKVNRQRFNFVSNKLGYVVDQLGLEHKIDTGGQELWNKVLKGDERAWKKFRKYNMQDVVITEQLFMALSPWINMPHKGMWSGNMMGCYSCDSTDLIAAGFIYSKAIAYPKMRCADCGAWNKLLRNGQTRAA